MKLVSLNAALRDLSINIRIKGLDLWVRKRGLKIFTNYLLSKIIVTNRWKFRKKGKNVDFWAKFLTIFDMPKYTKVSDRKLFYPNSNDYWCRRKKRPP